MYNACQGWMLSFWAGSENFHWWMLWDPCRMRNLYDSYSGAFFLIRIRARVGSLPKLAITYFELPYAIRINEEGEKEII